MIGQIGGVGIRRYVRDGVTATPLVISAVAAVDITAVVVVVCCKLPVASIRLGNDAIFEGGIEERSGDNKFLIQQTFYNILNLRK